MSRTLQFSLVTLTMVAFAANSLLNRAALVDGSIGPSSFAVIRVVAGAVTLLALAALQGKMAPPQARDLRSAAALSLYMMGFSYAYLSLDAGLGALLLFGGVQVTMFAGALIARESMPLQRWIGALIALGGLVLLLLPGGGEGTNTAGLALMLLAALGWGIYSLIGRGSKAPLTDTAWAFVLTLPVTIVALFLWPDQMPMQSKGILLAIVSGGLTSGCGYALWYHVLPGLGASRAAVAQLSVPVIATLGGVLLLSENLTLTMVVSGLLVIGGVAISLREKKTKP